MSRLRRYATLSIAVVLALLACLVCADVAAARDVYVDAFLGDDATTTGSRTDPFATITSALATTVAGDRVIVGPGFYPERISLVSGVSLEGAGEGLSLLWGGRKGSTVRAQSLASTATVSGFTISGGYASAGAGVLCDGSRLEIRDCEITNNTATSSSTGGGGLFIEYSSSAVIKDCDITGNSAPSGYGGGLIVYFNSSALIEDCTFSGNVAKRAGGMVVSNTGSEDIQVQRCLIKDNLATNPGDEYSTRGGGGVYLVTTKARFYDCVFHGNTAVGDGGAVLATDWASGPVFMNCTFVGNEAARGGGVYSVLSTSADKLANCILWDNGDDLDRCAAQYSCIEDGDAGTGNISSDPLFVSTADYRLQSSSPCIDAGASTWMSDSDFDGASRPIDGDRDGVALPDMGAFEAWGADTTAPDDPGLSSATHPESTWVTGTAAAVSIVAPSDFSGVAGYSVEWSEGHAHTPDTSVDLAGSATQTTRTLTEGEWYVSVRAVDGAGNWSAGTTYGPMQVDLTGPTVSDDASSAWEQGPAVVTLTAQDDGVGGTTFHYMIDSGEETATTSDVTITGTGIHELTYWGVDALGNVGPTATAMVRIDDEAPLATCDIDPAWQRGPVAVTIEAQDSDSGIESIEATVTDPPPGSTYTLSAAGLALEFDVSAEGTTTIEYACTDSAGHQSAPAMTIVRLDDTAPTVSIAPSATTFIDNAQFTLSAEDPLSGVAAVHYSIDGAVSRTGSSISVDTLGDHTVEYWSVDVAGNESPHMTHTFSVGASETTYVSVAGANRFATSVAASKHAFPDGADTVVIATGRDWPDALGGSALAGVHGGPILLSDTDTLPDAVAAEVTRLGASSAFILGGTGALGEQVEDDLAAAGISASRITRIGGANRYATSQLIARAVITKQGSDYDGTAFVVTGASFPDAVAGSPLAAANGWPVYLADASADPVELTSRMKSDGVTDAVVLGGTAAVSPAYVDTLNVGLDSAIRLAGATRYETATRIAEYGVSDAGLVWDGVGITSGVDFPDALTGGVLCARQSSVMLLVSPTTLPSSVSASLKTNRDLIGTVHYIGGTGSVGQPVRDAITRLLK